MRETDGRRLTQKEQEQARIQAARLLKSGMAAEQVAVAMGRSRAWAFGVAKAVREGGIESLEAVPRPEGKRKLDSRGRAELAVLIEGHTPQDHGYSEALWTREIVGDLIYQRWGLTCPARRSGRSCAIWGFPRNGH